VSSMCTSRSVVVALMVTHTVYVYMLRWCGLGSSPVTCQDGRTALNLACSRIGKIGPEMAVELLKSGADPYLSRTFKVSVFL